MSKDQYALSKVYALQIVPFVVLIEKDFLWSELKYDDCTFIQMSTFFGSFCFRRKYDNHFAPSIYSQTFIFSSFLSLIPVYHSQRAQW